MLRKLALVTVIPGTPGRDYRPASHECTSVAPPDVGGSPPPPDTGSTGIDPAPGAPILLEYADGSSAESVAPPPPGFVCRIETTYVYTPGQLEPAALYNVVCAEG